MNRYAREEERGNGVSCGFPRPYGGNYVRIGKRCCCLVCSWLPRAGVRENDHEVHGHTYLHGTLWNGSLPDHVWIEYGCDRLSWRFVEFLVQPATFLFGVISCVAMNKSRISLHPKYSLTPGSKSRA